MAEPTDTKDTGAKDPSQTEGVGPEGGDRIEEYPGQFAPAGTPVYRETPNPTGTTTTLPTVGAVATVDVWVEVYENSTTPSYILIVKAGQTYNFSPV